MVQSITSFRAYCFFAVFLFHCSELKFSAGWLGVQAFFVLSGFLLTPILVNMKNDLPLKLYLKNFYGRRALRIFPLCYAYLLIVTVLCLVMSGANVENSVIDNFLSSRLWSYSYTYNLYHATNIYEHSKLVTHFWSLAVEEQFYLIWPLVIWFVRGKYLKQALIFVVLLGPLNRFLIELIHTHGALPILNERIDLVIYVLPFSHIDAFAIGGLFALYGKGVSGKFSWLALTLTVLLGFATHFFATNSIDLWSLGFPAFMKDKYIFGYTVINIFFAFIILQIKSGAFAAPLFENKIAYYFGKISYGLYVFHFPCLWIVPRLMPEHGFEFMNEVIALLLSIFIASISYNLFESKIINLKDIYFPAKVDCTNKSNQSDIENAASI